MSEANEQGAQPLADDGSAAEEIAAATPAPAGAADSTDGAQATEGAAASTDGAQATEAAAASTDGAQATEGAAASTNGAHATEAAADSTDGAPATEAAAAPIDLAAQAAASDTPLAALLAAQAEPSAAMPPKVDVRDVSIRARELCAQLVSKTYLPRAQCQDLIVDDELRAQVVARLASVGLELVEHLYSDFVAVQLSRQSMAESPIAWSNNVRLDRASVALLVVLWAKLILPKRVAQERREDPEATNLEMFMAQSAAPRPATPKIQLDMKTLLAEFGERFGRRKIENLYLPRLRKLGFIKYSRRDTISEGPLLDLLIDGAEMGTKLRQSVLAHVLKELQPATAAAPGSASADGATPATAASSAPTAPATNPAAAPNGTAHA